MKERFSRSELSNSIFAKRGEGKQKILFVEQVLMLQESSDDGCIEFEGKNGMYVFCKSGRVVTFKRGNGSIVRKKMDAGATKQTEK